MKELQMKFKVYPTIVLLITNLTISAQNTRVGIDFGLTTSIPSLTFSSLNLASGARLENSYDNGISELPFTLGVNLSHTFDKIELLTGLRISRTNNFVLFDKFRDQSVIRAGTNFNYSYSTISLPIQIGRHYRLKNFAVLTPTIGLSFNSNQLYSYGQHLFLSTLNSDTVGIGASNYDDYKSFFSLGTLIGVKIRPQNFLKKFELILFLNYQLTGGALISQNSFLDNISIGNREEYNSTFKVRPSFVSFSINYNLFTR